MNKPRDRRQDHKPDCPCPACKYRRRDLAPMVRLFARVPPAINDAIGRRAKERGITRADLVRIALVDYLTRQ